MTPFARAAAGALLLIAGAVSSHAEDPAEAWRSALYPDEWTPAHTDAEGRFLHDFSYAGYARGERVPQHQGPVTSGLRGRSAGAARDPGACAAGGNAERQS